MSNQSNFVTLTTNDIPPFNIEVSFDDYKLLSSYNSIFQDILENFGYENLKGKSIDLDISKVLFDNYWKLVNGIYPQLNVQEIIDLFVFADQINHIIPKLLKSHEQVDPFLTLYVIPEILKTLNVEYLTLLMEVYPYLLIMSDYLNTRPDMPEESKMYPIEIKRIEEIRKNKEKYYTSNFYKLNPYNEKRGDKMVEFYKYIELGNLEVLKWLKDTFNITEEDAKSNNNRAFILAASKGHLEVLKWLTDTFNITEEDVKSNNNRAFILTASKGHLDVLKWLTDTFNITEADAKSFNNEAFRNAAGNGHLDVLKWLTDTFNITEADAKSFNNEAFRNAAGNGHLDVLKWLKENFNITEADVKSNNNNAFIQTAVNGHLDVLKWLKENFYTGR